MKTIHDSLFPSPCWLLDEKKLISNIAILTDIKQQSGAKILLALKGYALWKSFPTRPVISPFTYSNKNIHQ